MYKNLKIEMVRNGYNILQLSEKTGIKYQTLVGKIRGDSQFKFDECLKIKCALHSEMPLEVLLYTNKTIYRFINISDGYKHLVREGRREMKKKLCDIKDVKDGKGKEMDLATAFAIWWERETRPYRIIWWVLVAITFIYFLYILYEGKSLLNMLPLIIPLGFFPGEIFFSYFPKKDRK